MKRHLRLLIGLLVALSLLTAACGSDDDSSSGDTTTTEGDAAAIPDGPEIKLGAQNFPESTLLAEIYSQAFIHAGYEASVVDLGGYRDLLLGAFESGDVNFALDYAASGLEFLNGPDKTEATADTDETVALLEPYLEAKGIVAYEPAPGINTNAFVMTKDRSEELGITSLADLATKGKDLKLAASADCGTNPGCIPGVKDVYGADYTNSFTTLDSGTPIAEAVANDAADIGVLFTTDGFIADNDFVVLEDPEGLFKADNIIPIATKELADTYGDDFATLVNDISKQLTTDELVELSKLFTIDKEDADAIAEDWLKEYGFLD